MSKKGKSKIGLIILAAVFCYAISIFFDQQSILNKRKSELEAYEAKIEQEKQLNEDILKQKGQIDSDEYIENIAREKLGMIKPDEKVFVDINK